MSDLISRAADNKNRWKLQPFFMVPRLVNCPVCGLEGLPHWKRCPQCEAKLLPPDMTEDQNDGLGLGND